MAQFEELCVIPISVPLLSKFSILRILHHFKRVNISLK